MSDKILREFFNLPPQPDPLDEFRKVAVRIHEQIGKKCRKPDIVIVDESVYKRLLPEYQKMATRQHVYIYGIKVITSPQIKEGEIKCYYE
jgi:hypothetical protein